MSLARVFHFGAQTYASTLFDATITTTTTIPVTPPSSPPSSLPLLPFQKREGEEKYNQDQEPEQKDDHSDDEPVIVYTSTVLPPPPQPPTSTSPSRPSSQDSVDLEEAEKEDDDEDEEGNMDGAEYDNHTYLDNLPRMNNGNGLRSRLRVRERNSDSYAERKIRESLVFDVEDEDDDWQGSKKARDEAHDRRLKRTKEQERNRSVEVVKKIFGANDNATTEEILRPFKFHKKSKHSRRKILKNMAKEDNDNNNNIHHDDDLTTDNNHHHRHQKQGVRTVPVEGTCIVCLVRPRTHGILHAIEEGQIIGNVHQALCQFCVTVFIERMEMKCPVCRKQIESYVQIFNS